MHIKSFSTSTISKEFKCDVCLPALNHSPHHICQLSPTSSSTTVGLLSIRAYQEGEAKIISSSNRWIKYSNSGEKHLKGIKSFQHCHLLNKTKIYWLYSYFVSRTMMWKNVLNLPVLNVLNLSAFSVLFFPLTGLFHAFTFLEQHCLHSVASPFPPQPC